MRFFLSLSTAACLLALPAQAQSAQPGAPARLTLSLDEAVQIAVERAYAVRLAELEVTNARAQVSEAYGSLYPRADLTSSFTRNVVQSNPFAGSSAGSLFSGLGAIDWLAYNEGARTDDDPLTNPISLGAYRERIQQGYDDINYIPNAGSNPFGVDNQFQNSIAISQPLYSRTAFAAVRGARGLVEINEIAVEQQEDATIHQTRQLFFGALLAQESATVQRASVERARQTASDASMLVEQGVRPKLERLNAEVDLANAETQVVTSEAQASNAVDQLTLALGLPAGTQIQLSGELDEPPPGIFRTIGLAAASASALDLRPDVRQAEIAIGLNEVQKSITNAARYPSLNAFVNLGYTGSVPDDRGFISTPNPDDPFTFESGSSGFFSGGYWNPSVSVGLSLKWTLFDGFQTRYRAQQNQVAVDRAKIQLEQVQNVAQLEVASAIRDLQSAQRRLAAQRQTVETAETAYDFASARLSEGVATQADVRISSQNLDLARLNYFQAIHDALVARSKYELATGTIAPPEGVAPPEISAER